jgi:WD40 repeat protein
VLGVAWSTDGARLVTADLDRTARIWNPHTGEPLALLSPRRRYHRESGSFVPFPRAQFSADGNRLLMLGSDGAIRLWDGSGRLLAERRGSGGNLINYATFSHDGRRIAAASDDSTVHVYDGRTGALIRTLSTLGQELTQSNFSADGRLIVGASASGLVRVWDVQTGAQLASLRGNSTFTSVATFSSDGVHILTAAPDGSARVHTCLSCRSPEDLVRIARRTAGRSLTKFERTQYLHEER